MSNKTSGTNKPAQLTQRDFIICNLDDGSYYIIENAKSTKDAVKRYVDEVYGNSPEKDESLTLTVVESVGAETFSVDVKQSKRVTIKYEEQ